MVDLKLPKRKLTDATHTRGLQLRYRKDITNLYQQFKKDILPKLGLLNLKQEGILRNLGVTFDHSSEITIYATAPRIIDKNINLSYKAGKRRAVNNNRLTKNNIVISMSLTMMDKKIIEDLKTRNFSLIVKATEDMKTEMLRIFSEDITQGKGINEITRNLMDNITDISRTRAEMIARTETAFSYNNAIAKTYQAEGIEQWQWLATLGVNCCEECIGNHGVVFDWGDQQPPLHPNCWIHHGVQILTDSGEKPICDIQIGDNVMTHKGHFKKVTRLLDKKQRYNGDVVRIMFKGRTNLSSINHRNCVTVTPGHPFLTKRGWIEAKDIDLSDELFVVANHCRYCGEKIPYWKDFCNQNHKFKYMPELCKKISESKKGENNWMYGRYGELNPSWKGGKIQYRGGDWDKIRINALKRDNFICQNCGINNDKCNELYGQNLQVHHITPYRDCKCNELDNLMTVCHRCHGLIEGTNNNEILQMGGFEFISVPILKKERISNFKGEKLYNFAVEDDESYIAKGVISHNCLCTILPVVKER